MTHDPTPRPKPGPLVGGASAPRDLADGAFTVTHIQPIGTVCVPAEAEPRRRASCRDGTPFCTAGLRCH